MGIKGGWQARLSPAAALRHSSKAFTTSSQQNHHVLPHLYHLHLRPRRHDCHRSSGAHSQGRHSYYYHGHSDRARPDVDDAREPVLQRRPPMLQLGASLGQRPRQPPARPAWSRPAGHQRPGWYHLQPDHRHWCRRDQLQPAGCLLRKQQLQRHHQHRLHPR